MENNGEQFLKAYFVLLLLPLGVRWKRSLSFNNLDSWLTFYVLETLSVMLVRSHTWFGLIQFSQALLLWNDFYFWEEKLNLHFIWFSKNKKPDCSKILPYPFLHSILYSPFLQNTPVTRWQCPRSGPRARATLPETSLRNKSEQDRRPGPLQKAKVWMPKKA